MAPYDNLILLRCIGLKAKLLPAMWCVHTNPHALFNVGGRNLLTQADHKLCKLTNFDDIPRKQGRVDSWWRTGTSSKHQRIKKTGAYTRAILPRKCGQQGCYKKMSLPCTVWPTLYSWFDWCVQPIGPWQPSVSRIVCHTFTHSYFCSRLHLGFTLNRLNSGLTLFRNQQEHTRTLIKAGDIYVHLNSPTTPSMLLGCLVSSVPGSMILVTRATCKACSCTWKIQCHQCQEDPLVHGSHLGVARTITDQTSSSNFASFGFQPSQLFQVWSDRT